MSIDNNHSSSHSGHDWDDDRHDVRGRTIRGTNGNDILTGTAGNDTIHSRAATAFSTTTRQRDRCPNRWTRRRGAQCASRALDSSVPTFLGRVQAQALNKPSLIGHP